MFISAQFVPTNFEILDFYDQEMCFAWTKDKFVIFPYVKPLPTSPLPTHVAPREIKSLRCFSGRVFVVCNPYGVYKILRTFKFMPLSSVGLSQGPHYYEVLIPENKWLLSANKLTKTDRRLFQLQLPPNGTYNLQDLILNATNSELSLRQAIHLDETSSEDISIVANNKRVFKVTSSETLLIHRSEHEIIRIVGIFKGEMIAGFALVMHAAAVLVYVNNGKLVFDKVYLGSNVQDLCAGMSKNLANIIWLVHIDNTGIHYWIKSIKEDTFRKIKMESERSVAIRNYKCKLLICLSNTGQLSEFGVDALALAAAEQAEFVGLKSEMLRGTEEIVNAICARAKELQNWNELLLKEQDKLKKINIYSHKQKIACLPDVRVERIAGREFVRIKFDVAIQLNCHVVVGLVTDKRFNYCIKFVEDSETNVDLSLNNEKFDESTTIQVDLVTLAEESKAWCVIRDYTKNPKTSSHAQIPNEKINFIKAKLAALRNLTNDDGITIKKLSAFKKTIRKELSRF